MEYVPKKTTDLLIKLCTEKVTNLDTKTKETKILSSSPDDFAYLFVNNQTELRQFLEEIIKKNPSQSQETYQTLMELYFREFSKYTNDGKRKFKIFSSENNVYA
eukprot:UN27995